MTSCCGAMCQRELRDGLPCAESAAGGCANAAGVDMAAVDTARMGNEALANAAGVRENSNG